MNLEFPTVSVIVLNYNGREFLEDCFRSLGNLDYLAYEVIMVDNASTDGSVEYVREHFPWVRVVGLESNYGFSRGNDVGVEYACGKYVAFLNNDVEVEPAWLSELVEGIEEDEKVASCGSKMLFYESRNYVNHAGGAVTITGAGYDIGFMMEEKEDYNQPKFVGCTSGGAMLVRKDVFCKLGGFDPDYFAYFEDVDFCLRAWIAGYKIKYMPTSVVYHKFGGSFGTDSSPFKMFLYQRNRLYNIAKNFEPKNFLLATMTSMAYDVYKISQFLIYGKFTMAVSIIHGNLSFISNLRRVMKKRRVVQDARKVSDRELFEIGVVLGIRESLKELKSRRKFKGRHNSA
ncbi:MAG: glycosyltransferase family 2 protein [Halobacteriota archaeon]